MTNLTAKGVAFIVCWGFVGFWVLGNFVMKIVICKVGVIVL